MTQFRTRSFHSQLLKQPSSTMTQGYNTNDWYMMVYYRLTLDDESTRTSWMEDRTLMNIWTSLRVSVSAGLTLQKPRMKAAACMTATAGWLTKRGLKTAAAPKKMSPYQENVLAVHSIYHLRMEQRKEEQLL